MPRGVRQFIHVGATMDEKTIFENVERVPAASLHINQNESWTTRRLWRLTASTPDSRITRQSATKAAIDSFVGNFEFTANVEPGRAAADLTGGTDSRTVLCCLMEKHPQSSGIDEWTRGFCRCPDRSKSREQTWNRALLVQAVGGTDD